MSDLVERLQSHMGKADMGDVLRDCRLAAARIEALEAALQGWHMASDILNDRIRRLEAALQEIHNNADWTLAKVALAPEQDKEAIQPDGFINDYD